MIYFDKKHNTYFDKSQIKEEDIVFSCEDSVWSDFCRNPDKYYWENDEFVQDPDWEEKQSQKERELRINEIKQELNELDLKTIRPMRAGESERVEALEEQAQKLREELNRLKEKDTN